MMSTVDGGEERSVDSVAVEDIEKTAGGYSGYSWIIIIIIIIIIYCCCVYKCVWR